MDVYAELEKERKLRQLAEREAAGLRAEVDRLRHEHQQAAERRRTLRRRLRSRQQFMCRLTQATAAGFYVYHAARHRVGFLNEHLGRQLGYTPDEMRQMAPQVLDALLHPYDKRRIGLHYRKLFARPDDERQQIEVRLLSKDGRWKWLRLHDAVLTRDAQGNATQLIGSAQDISDEKHWLKRLTWQKDFYESILNNIPAHISVFNTEHVYLYANPREIRNAHINKWVIGKDDFAYCRALNRDISVARNRHRKFREAVKSRQEVVWEDAYANSQGEPVYYLRKFHPVLNEAGKVSYVIGYAVDISQRRRAELQLADQQALVRQVIEASPNPIYVRDADGRFLLANDAYARLHRLSIPALLSGPPAYDYAYERDMEILAAAETVSFEEAYKQPGQLTRWYNTFKKPFEQPNGTRYLLSISSDVTDLNAARLVAEESARAKQLFLTNMSHEIRTPMNGILGLARLLKRSYLTDEQARYLDVIISSTENLLVVINDILDFAKIESGRVDLEQIPFDVAVTLLEASRSLSFQAQEKGLQVRTLLPPGELLPVVAGDPFRLRQVLVNLLNNAIKFTPSGHISVEVSLAHLTADTAHLRFSVADTGIGISPDKLDDIFQSFAQATTSTSRLFGGTGLGLTICKSLVELQGGRIGVESVLGQGSRFFFELAYPLTDELPPAAAAEQAVAADLLRGLHVLLVEDNAVNKLLATSLLAAWDVRADVADDGQQALEQAASRPYDLILMDIQMPRLNGLEATARLRRQPGPNQHTPIVALTANALKNDVESYGQLGFNEHLVKPYHELDLYRVIARHTGRHTPVAPAQPPPTPSYTFAGLGKLAQNPAFIRQMQQLFVDTVPEQLRELGTALEQQNWEAAALLTHTLKSTYGNLQMVEATTNIKRLEQVIKTTADPTELTNLLHYVKLVTKQMVQTFAAELQLRE